MNRNDMDPYQDIVATLVALSVEDREPDVSAAIMTLTHWETRMVLAAAVGTLATYEIAGAA